jgi:hypothetical protein
LRFRVDTGKHHSLNTQFYKGGGSNTANTNARVYTVSYKTDEEAQKDPDWDDWEDITNEEEIADATERDFENINNLQPITDEMQADAMANAVYLTEMSGYNDFWRQKYRNWREYTTRWRRAQLSLIRKWQIMQKARLPNGELDRGQLWGLVPIKQIFVCYYYCKNTATNEIERSNKQ